MAGISFCCFVFVKAMARIQAEAVKRIRPELEKRKKKAQTLFDAIETRINNPPEFSPIDPLKFDCITAFFKELNEYCEDLSEGDLVTGESVQKKIIELCAKNFQNQEVEK